MEKQYTEAEREKMDAWLRDWTARFPYGEQDENGVDLSLLRENLKRTPTERLRRHHQSMLGIRELDRARIRRTGS